MVNIDHVEPSSSSGGRHDVAGNNVDFITMNDLVQDMSNSGGEDEDGEPAVVKPEDVELFEEIIGNDNFMFGSPEVVREF
jgi:hypothetical protein